MKKVLIIGICICLFGTLIFMLIHFNNKPENNDKTVDKEIAKNLMSDKVKFTSLDLITNVKKSNLYTSKCIVNQDENIFIECNNNKYILFFEEDFLNIKVPSNNLNVKDIIDTFGAIIDANQKLLGGSSNNFIKHYKNIINNEETNNGIIFRKLDNLYYIAYKYDELLKFNVVNKTYHKGELININEDNYDVNFDNFKFNDISFGYTSELNSYSICGNFIFKSFEKEINFTLYDKNKKIIDVVKLDKYNNKLNTSCVNFDIKNNKYFDIGYYSVNF